MLEWLWQQAARQPGAEALVDGERRLTYAELDRAAAALAGAIAGAGVAAGDRVGLACDNSAAFVVAYLAILRSGAVLVPLNPAAPPDAGAAIVRETRMRLLLADAPARAGVEDPRRLPLAGFMPGPGSSADLWIGIPAHDPATPDAGVPEGLQAILYTSGTTGLPKGVMLTATALREVAEAGAAMLGLAASDRVGVITPLFHLYALREIDAAVRSGACLVVARSLTFPAAVLRLMHAERVTYVSGVPAGFALFLDRYAELLGATCKHLRAIAIGTAPCPAALLAGLRSALPRTTVFLTYGLTEASRVCFRAVAEPDLKAGAIGRPYPGVELAALDAAGAPLPRGSEGRIALRTAMAAVGYWGRAEATEALIRADGWLLSPDHGRIDADGYLFLLGRIDDVINTGGEKVSPDEVEQALARHPGVAGVAVLSVPDPGGRLGEIVQAVIVAAPGARLEAEELQQFCAGRLEPHKVPRAFRFVAALPRTALGKIDRGRLRSGGD